MIDLSLYLVADTDQAARHGRDVASTAAAAAAGGVTTVQIREKHRHAREILEIVQRTAEALPSHVALIVNDRVDVFLAARQRGVRVDGVHLGQSDLSAEDARRLIGDDAVLGVSAATPGHLRRATADPARVDYVGIGAVHPTRTKPDAPDALGIDGVARLLEGLTLPAVAIGGVTIADVAGLRAAGAAGIAVVSAICDAGDPRAAAEALATAWDDAR